MIVHLRDLAESIRTRVLMCNLPRDLRTPVVTRPGSGAGVCTCCARPIAPLQAQHDVEQQNSNGTISYLSMDSDCFRLWRREVETLYLLDRAAGVSPVPTGEEPSARCVSI